MAIISALLADIKLRYRHTFTDAQVVVWMNDEQTELFEILEIDSIPYAFNTVVDQFLYPLDDGIDIDRIKELSIQVNDSSPPEFYPLPFQRMTDDVNISDYWYTLIERNFYINVPSGTVDDRVVYVYLDTGATAIDPLVLSVEPATPARYQELLKLGTLKCVAAARKDTLMQNNYDSTYQEKIADVQWKMKMETPEFETPVDVMPRISNKHYYRRRC